MPNGFAKGQSSCRLADEAGSSENVDAIAHFSWADRRPGLWTFIGQACGKSESWEVKVNEPSGAAWASFFGRVSLPAGLFSRASSCRDTADHKLVQDSQRGHS